MQLIALAKSPEAANWNADRRARVFQKVMARVERDRERRRLLWAFAAGAAAILAAISGRWWRGRAGRPA
jgi:hypothetical protein